MTVIQLPTAQAAGKSTPDHGHLASYLTHGEDLIYTEKRFWQFDDERGIWEPVPDEAMIQKAERICRQAGAEVTANRINGVLKLATGQAHRVIQWNQSGQRDICASNGVLHYEGGGKWAARPYRREDYRRISLPITYNPKATCPRFTRFVQEIFHGCDDAKERTLALVEMMALTLTATTEYEKAALLVGSGSNGKSVVLRLLSDMLGEYVSGVNPAEFDNRFQRGSIDGKLANIVTELPEGTTLPDGAIKAIISGEACTVERKFKDPFVMTPIAKIWIGSNHMPGTRDFSPALFRRFTILKFPNKFVDTEAELGPGVMLKDIRLAEKLRAEIPGILNVLLRALGNAFDRGYLTSPPSSIDAVDQWKRDSDQVLTFLEEEIIREPGAKITSAEIYSLYQSWAQSAGIQRPVNRKNFTTRVEALGWATAGKSTGGTRCLWGVRQRFGGDL
ncbi:DNA primase family protein [Acidithiobacillus sulfuriphilus]|uniref:DNA primase family protein n=1 Tax=Acidithiobacillus sulfuriphilus TaxID=1867749 RepID=UPI003F5DBE60